MSKLTNITAPQYRCSVGGCPGIYISEDGKTYTIVGDSSDGLSLPDGAVVGDHAEVIEISVDLVLASLGVTALVEAAERVLNWRDPIEVCAPELGGAVSAFEALRSALNKIKGGDNADQ